MSDNQQFCLRWNNHQSTLVQVIDNLLSSGVLVDCTLAAEGQYLHAHKVVLCACSPYLETLLSQHYEKHPIVILKDVKFQELKSMMDYMYKGEVNISQDQLGQFLKAAESLQIKGLTDGGGGEGDTRDVGSTSQKRHEPTPVRKSIPHNQSRSPVVLPPHTSGLTIEPSKRTLPTHLSESQPDSPIRSREGSTSPTPRKRRRQRRLSQGEEDGHADNSCDLPMQSQSMSITSVPSSIPALSSGSSSTITKAPPPDEDSENPESDRLSGLPEGLLKEKIEPQSEMLLEPKTEYMDETNNDDSVEDLTLDDDDDYDGMIESGAGPSHGSNNPNENYAAWQQMASDRQDDAYLNPADGGHRDSQELIQPPVVVSDASWADYQRRTLLAEYILYRQAAMNWNEEDRRFEHIPGLYPHPLDPTSVRKHRDRSKQESRWECDRCGKRYKYSRGLAMHRRLECGKEPMFHCPYCPQKCHQKAQGAGPVIRVRSDIPNLKPLNFQNSSSFTLLSTTNNFNMQNSSSATSNVMAISQHYLNKLNCLRMSPSQNWVSSSCDMYDSSSDTSIVSGDHHLNATTANNGNDNGNGNQQNDLSMQNNNLHSGPRKHNREKEPIFACLDCGKRYRSKTSLSLHKRLECGKEPAFQCPFCPLKTHQKGNLQVHIKKKHSDPRHFIGHQMS